MSRPPISLSPVTISVIQGTVTNHEEQDVVEAIYQAQYRDREVAPCVEYVRDGVTPEEKSVEQITRKYGRYLELVDDHLFFIQPPRGQRRLVVPAQFRSTLLHMFHDQAFEGGHRQLKTTFEKLSSRFWWPGMYEDTTSWVRTCQTCQAFKRRAAELQHGGERSIPTEPWQHLFIDTISLPSSKGGHQYAYVCIDAATRYAEVTAVKVANAQTMAAWLFKEVICRHGCPVSITSDRGPEYVNAVVSALYELLKVKHNIITAYRPQSNGLVERLNGTLKMSIRKCAEVDNVRNWHEWLPFIMFAYNNTVHSSTHYTPFFLMHGREARLPVDIHLSIDGDLIPTPVETYVRRLQMTLQDARTAAYDMQEDRRINKTWPLPATPRMVVSTPRYTVGQRVYVYTDHGRTGMHKLFNRTRTGPFTIVKVLSENFYVLDIEGQEDTVHFTRLAPYFHEQQLPSLAKPITRTDTRTATPAVPAFAPTHAEDTQPGVEQSALPPYLNPDVASMRSPPLSAHGERKGDESDSELEVEQIVGKEVLRRRSRTQPADTYFRVIWRGYTSEEDTWEPVENLENCKELIGQYERGIRESPL